MQTPLRLEFRNVDRSTELEDAVRQHVDKLERLSDEIVGCRAVVELPHRHKSHGERYHVLVAVEVPGTEIVVSDDPGDRERRVDAFAAIHDAFDAAERQLRDYVRQRRLETKTHYVPSRGRAVELDEGFGRLEALVDGREIYFHRNSVVDDGFDALEVGNEVLFEEEPGNEGPQAVFVKRIGAGRIPE